MEAKKNLLASLVRILVLVAACPVSARAAPRVSGSNAALLAARGDALLRDVFFVNAAQGWAVGDRGVIWRTADGGRSWRLQYSPVTCPLHSVQFVDENIGWAAGGTIDPYTFTSRGVLLATRDGGRRWELLTGLLLPGLKRIKFFNSAQGWAVGDSCGLWPTGVFTTENGGRNWTPASGDAARSWADGDFADPLSGALAGRDSSLAAVRRRGFGPSRSAGFGIRSVRRLRLTFPLGAGWLAGDGGLAMRTGDLGLTWRLPPARPPSPAAEMFDFHALAAHGPRCWIAGSPGTRVFHTADAGKSWRVQSTGQHAPLHGICFVDDQHGWAVGALGTILATSDGGRSWQVQRNGGTRAALLGLFGHPEQIPLEMFAQLCGNDGYLGVVNVIARRDLDQGPVARLNEMERGNLALLDVGGQGVESPWRFPVRQSGVATTAKQIIDGWNRANDGQGRQRLEEYLVRQIRLWRPEIVVTHAGGPRDEEPLARLVSQAVIRAAKRAGDPTSYTRQAVAAGLRPWKVKKVFGLLPRGRQGTVNLVTSQLAPRLGRSLAEAAVDARAMIVSDDVPVPPTLEFRLSHNALPQGTGTRGFFHGIALPPGGEARRHLSEPAASLDSLHGAARKYRNAEAILLQAAGQEDKGAKLLAQLGVLLEDVDGDSAGRLVYRLGRSYFRAGEGELAAQAFRRLLQRHPRHPAAPAALFWLVQYYSSGETGWRLQRTPRAEILPAAAAIDPRDPLKRVVSAGGPNDESALVLHSAAAGRPALAHEIGKLIQRSDPLLFGEPRLRFPLAAAHANNGYPRQAERFYLAARRTRPDDAWRRCASAARWLAGREGPPPLPVAVCRRAKAKPHLDGKLDDETWQGKPRWPLMSVVDRDDKWPAFAQLAVDDAFLYLALTCRRAPGVEYPAAGATRERDEDLSRRDRVELLLDVDRDHATYYRLAVDHRGHVFDDCWGDSTWDPHWYVAADADEQVWRIEAAIPLRQLTAAPVNADTVWAIGLQRTVPGLGFQSWSTPASTQIQPEGFGYLLFE